MEYEKSGITSEDVVKNKNKKSSSPNPSTDTQIHSSDIGAGIETGSTVGRDLMTNATSRRMHSSSSSSSSFSVSHHHHHHHHHHGNDDDIKDAESRALNPTAEAEEGQQESQASGGGCVIIPDLTPATHNPSHGGGVYGADVEVASPRKKLGRASDAQSAEGPTPSDMRDTHKDIKPTTTTTTTTSSVGNRGQEILGQSYIQ